MTPKTGIIFLQASHCIWWFTNQFLIRFYLVIITTEISNETEEENALWMWQKQPLLILCCLVARNAETIVKTSAHRVLLPHHHQLEQVRGIASLLLGSGVFDRHFLQLVFFL